MIELTTVEEATEALREMAELEPNRSSPEWDMLYQDRYLVLAELLEDFSERRVDLFELAIGIVYDDLSVDFSEIAEGRRFDFEG